MTRRNSYGLLLLAAAGTIFLAGCGSDDDVPIATPLSCAAINGMAIPAASIGLPTTGAVVTSTTVVPAAGSGATAVGEYCRVLGDINPVDATAPKIKFQVNLPSTWNSRAMMYGGGGYNGTIATGTGNVAAGPPNQPTPLGRGYATFGSDSGHQAGAFGSRDGSFGANDEALRNYAGDALKKTRDVAVTIIKARYATDNIARTYFAGNSTGGREALLVVQNWPNDFDGALVMFPAWNAAALNLQLGRMTRQLALPGAYPNREKRKVLYDAAIAACDTLDGVADELISNQAACDATFNPATATLGGNPIRCPNGADVGNTCLSDAQIASFNVLNTELTLPYTLASGETTYPGYFTWGTDFGIPSSSPIQPKRADTIAGDGAARQSHAAGRDHDAALWQYLLGPMGQIFCNTRRQLQFAVARSAEPGFLAGANRPVDRHPGCEQDRSFSLSGARGQDPDGTRHPRRTRQHPRDATVSGAHPSAMGAANVRNFLRYYEIPGYGHLFSSHFSAAWDSVTALEDWVERGVAPPPQIVADTAGVPGRTRPLCEFPTWPKYNGSGDVNAAASFTCATN